MRLQLSTALPKTVLEWLIIAVIIAIIVLLLLPASEWASSGTINVPVHVVVFDGETASPISDAVVAIIWAPPATGDFALERYHEYFSAAWKSMAAGKMGVSTGPDGSITIDFEFRTGASHVNPEPRAHTRWYWLLVSAEDYGAVAVPLRYDSMTTKSLRQQKSLPAYVGLVRNPSSRK
jgi:hypothetical protein